MVSTFLASAANGEESRNGRPSVGERMSVVALAIRLRLGATRPVTDVRLRHRVLYCIALMALLLLALGGTTEIVGIIHRAVLYAQGELVFRGSDASFVATMIVSALLSLLWVVAFWGFVLGRYAIPRLAMLVTAAAMLAMVLIYIPEYADSALGALSVIVALLVVAMFALLVIAAFQVPADARVPRPWLWLGGYVIGSLVFVSNQVFQYVSADRRPPSATGFDPWLSYLSPTTAASVALLVGMVAALASAAGRGRADWLFALALVAGGLVLVAPGANAFDSTGSMSLNTALIVLAVACALRGRVAARAGWR